jgi:hypothetical protein
MPIEIGPGVSLGGGITIEQGFATSVSLTYDLDAANYSAVPTNASVTAGEGTTGQRTLTVANAGGSISWNSANGGLFRKSNAVGTDVIYGGPNWSTGQSYSVFTAYKLSATSAGRLLNTQNEATRDWLLGAYNGFVNTFYPNYAVNLPSSGANTVWNFAWGTWNASTGLGQLYTATNTQPVGTAFTATNLGSGGGPNQIRLFSRSAGTEVQTGDIGFVKAYNGILTLADVQGLYNQYKARFGY